MIKVQYVLKVERTNTKGQINVSYISKYVNGSFKTGSKVLKNVDEKTIVKMEAEAKLNYAMFVAMESHLDKAQKNIEKGMSDKGHKVTIVIASAALIASTLALGVSLHNLIKPATVKSDDKIVEVVEENIQMSEAIMLADIKGYVTYLKERGLSVKPESLTAFYYVNNSALFTNDLTKQLIEDGILPDSNNQIMDAYNATINDIINRNIAIMYIDGNSLSKEQVNAKLIKFSTFAKNDLDKAFINTLDNVNLEMFFAKDKATAKELFNTNYDLLIGMRKTASNDSVNELTAGGQYLATMGTGIITTVHGNYNAVGQEKTRDLEKIIEDSRLDIRAYIADQCDLYQSNTK